MAQQNRWQRLTNNVLSRKEAVVFGLVLFGLGYLTCWLVR